MAEGIPIGGSGNIGPAKPPADLGSSGSSGSSNSGFESFVKGTETSGAQKPSPMNVAQSAQPSIQPGQATPQTLVANMQHVLGQMAGLQAGLRTPDLKLNTRTKRLLDAKLKRTKDNIDYIDSKVNVGDENLDDDESPGEEKIANIANKRKMGKDGAFSKFINYLTDGQSQLEGAMQSVSHLHDNKDPGLMMEDIFTMQTKLYRAQVEIEFSTAVLQKAIDDLKTLMSVQL